MTGSWGLVGRAVLVNGLLLTLGLGCSRQQEGQEGQERREAKRQTPVASSGSARAGSGSTAPGRVLPAEERTWVFESTPLGRMVALVLLPERREGQRFPVLVTMHGRGEALKGPDRGARGWVDDYRLAKVIERLQRPPLTRGDFLSFVSSTRLEQLNRALSEQAYGGLVIVCPYTPDALGGAAFFQKAQPLAGFLVDELLPRVYREAPALGTAASTGIDGVSLGGRAAYSVGLLRPEAFGVVAGVQAAFDVEDAPVLLARARQAVLKNPKLSFGMLTSDGDYFREADTAIAEALRGAGLPMHFNRAEGPHDYDFNRGPGAIEMLMFHDRVLRGHAPL